MISIVLVAMNITLYIGCTGPNAFLYDNGKMLKLPDNTKCGKVETRCFYDKTNQMIQIKFTETIPDRNIDKMNLIAYREGKEINLNKINNYNNMNDTSYFIIQTAPGVLSFFAPTADSLHIDLRQVLLSNSIECFPSVLTLIPIKE